MSRRAYAVACLVLLAAAVGVRLWLYSRTHVVNSDAVYFLEAAERFLSGEFREGLDQRYHPFYPAAMAALSKVTGLSLIHAGYAVSIFLGSLVVLPLLFLGARLFGAPAGVLAAFLYVVHPYAVRFSVQIKCDATYYFFFTAAVALGWGAIRGSRREALLCGAAVGLAYLARPEGILVAVGVAVWMLSRWLSGSREPRRRVLGRLALLGVVLALLASPYIGYLSAREGGFTFTGKKELGKSIALLRSHFGKPEGRAAFEEKVRVLGRNDSRRDDPAGAGEKEPESSEKRARGGLLLWAFGQQMLEWTATVHPAIMTFFGLPILFELFHLAVARRRFVMGRREGYCWFFTLLYFPLFYIGLIALGYLSRRVLFAPTILLLVPAGYGLFLVGRALGFVGEQIRTGSGRSVARYAVAVLVVIAVSTTLPKGLKARGEDDIPHMLVGLWIRGHGIERPVIVSNLEKVPVYAEGRYVKMMRGSFKRQMRLVAKERADYFVVSTKTLGYRCPDFPLEGRAGILRPVYSMPAKEDGRRYEIIVYEVLRGGLEGGP